MQVPLAPHIQQSHIENIHTHSYRSSLSSVLLIYSNDAHSVYPSPRIYEKIKNKYVNN